MERQQVIPAKVPLVRKPRDGEIEMRSVRHTRGAYLEYRQAFDGKWSDWCRVPSVDLR